jgi:predicted ATP-grasp superfamily ATP-dependent carboligase
MIKLLKYLAENLKKEDLYNLAIFMSQNPDIIDQETMLHIIHEVNEFETMPVTDELNEKLDEIKNHFDKLDKETNKHEELHKLLKDNNIGLN